MRTQVVYIFIFIFFLSTPDGFSQNSRSGKTSEVYNELPAYPVNISEQLRVFQSDVANASYRISVCADVPNNKKPMKVAQRQESGHVFLILQKMNAHDTIHKVFGFYPKRGLPVLFFKRIKSKIKDNSTREYDVVISKELTAEQFDTVISRSVQYAGYIYHINKFNCYEYAIEIFNSIAGDHPLPLTHVRFPFIYGRGGSPVSVYKDLKLLKETGSVWAPNIAFGHFIAPVSTGRKNNKER